MHGKTHSVYYGCLRLLVCIHEAKNELDEAQAVSELLPAELQKRELSKSPQPSIPQRELPSPLANYQILCKPCQDAKTECSMERPTCQQCKDRQQRCVYSASRDPPGSSAPPEPTQAQFARLDKKLPAIESKLQTEADEHGEHQVAQTGKTEPSWSPNRLRRAKAMLDLSLPVVGVQAPRLYSDTWIGSLSPEELMALTDSQGRVRDAEGQLKEENIKGKRHERKQWLNATLPVGKITAREETSEPASSWPSTFRVELEDSSKIVVGNGAVQCYSRYGLDRSSTRPSNSTLLARDRFAGTLYQTLVREGISAGKLFKMVMGSDDFDTLSSLLDSVDMNAALEDEGELPLSYAAGLGGKVTSALLVFLVRSGACLNAVDQRGYTALMIAVEAFCIEDLNPREFPTRTLLDLGADMSHRAPSGESAYSLALRAKGADLLRRMFGIHALGLHAFGMHNMRDAEGRTSLHYAAVTNEACGTDFRMNYLLGVSHPVDVKDVYGMTPFMIAAQFGTSQAARELLDAGATLDARDSKGRTPLMIAISEGNFDVAWALIRWADNPERWKATWPRKLDASSPVRRLGISFSDTSGRTALMMALFWRNRKLANVLTVLHRRERLSLDAADELGCTALHFAASAGFVDIVSTLIETGVDINKQSTFDGTALLNAAREGHRPVVQYLKSRVDVAANQKALFHIAQQRRFDDFWVPSLNLWTRLEVLKLRDEYGCTILMEATSVGNTSLVDLLLAMRRYSMVKGVNLGPANETRESIVDITIRRKVPDVTNLVRAVCRELGIPFGANQNRLVGLGPATNTFPIAALPDKTRRDERYKKLSHAEQTLLLLSDPKSTALTPKCLPIDQPLMYTYLETPTVTELNSLLEEIDRFIQDSKRDLAQNHRDSVWATWLSVMLSFQFLLKGHHLKLDEVRAVRGRVAEIKRQARSGANPGIPGGTGLGGLLTSRNLQSIGSSIRQFPGMP